MPDDPAKNDRDNIALAAELARLEAMTATGAISQAAKAERARCAAIAARWALNADAMLGAGWRSAEEIAIAERVARAIAHEIMGCDDE